MVIFEGTISHRVLKDVIPHEHEKRFDDIVIGLANGAAISLFVYYFFKLLVFLHDGHWIYLDSAWGYWYVLEVVGLVLVPCFLFAIGARHRNLGTIRLAAILTLLGIILNRLNVTIIAFNWYVPNHYYPSWQEIVVTLMIIFTEVWVFRWVVTRMPVFGPESALPKSDVKTGG